MTVVLTSRVVGLDVFLSASFTEQRRQGCPDCREGEVGLGHVTTGVELYLA
jgi:hypothetical protein